MENTAKPIIDANDLEAMAKQRPQDKFLKGSGVLKLIQAIRDLERANRQLQAQQPTNIDNLRKALQFYADGHHFAMHDETAWDTVSGEPVNFYEDEAGTATVEDGSIAKLALEGHPIKFDDEAQQTGPTPDGEPSNVELRGLWHGAGGAFHGPNIETGTMPEEKLLPFLRDLVRARHPAPSPLAADHQGMRVDYSGLLSQCQRAMRRTEPGLAEMLRQLQGHMQELGQRWYGGDTAVVDEILQLYCVEHEARQALKGGA
ncbi:hypothetical protein [Acidovorax sp. BL-A-41-H1]|uniref:hypothetical protein n=1 Tax=Acidovorax sp. BL-A-41-H1 TaxID=3421102 RepID=UPI003F78E7B7